MITEPRVKSPEFHDTVKSIKRELPKDLLSKLIFINADTPAENRRWLKKNNYLTNEEEGGGGGGIRIFSDEKREFMQAYTALGDKRWSMTLFVIADERIQKIVRELSYVDAPAVVERAVRAMEKRRY
jgi:hypothetical protein